MSDKCKACGSNMNKSDPYHCNECKWKYEYTLEEIIEMIKDRER